MYPLIKALWLVEANQKMMEGFTLITKKSGNTLEEKMIAHCAPTLARLKTANMFRCRYNDIETLQEELRLINENMNEKGVYVEALKIEAEHVLLYVYRSNKLQLDLAVPAVSELLAKYGYHSCEVVECIKKLKERIADNNEFPHEIGIFLGYPLEDVLGFIEHKGQNFKYSGLWKVYGDVQETLVMFSKFKKCTDVYKQVFEAGRSLTQMTVAA